MSDQDNIFTGDQPIQPETVDNPSTQFAIPDTVADLIGEGRKYKTIEDALNSIPNAQAHISKIEEENAGLRIQADKVSNIDSTLEKIEANINQGNTTPTVEFDPSNITTIVDDRLKAQDELKQKQTNVLNVISTMKDVFGDKASDTFNKAATDNGMSIDELNKLSETSPKAVLKLIGIDNKSSLPSTSNGSVNTESITPVEQVPSAKVPAGATSKDMTQAWRNTERK